MALTGLPSKRSVELMAGDKPEQKRAAGELYEYLKRLDDSLRALGIAVPAPVSTTGYAAAPGGSLALPAGQKPLPPASGAQVAGFVVMLTDGRQAVIDPAFLASLDSASGRFIRMAYDNVAPNRTGLINTLLEGTTGAPFGTLFYIRNLGGIGANGLGVEMPNGGTGNGIVVTVTGSMTGVNSGSVTGAAGSFLNDSASAFSLVCGNADASLRHASFGSDLFVIGPRVFFRSVDPVNGAIILEAATPAGATQTQTLQDATGTIALLEADQTFTGHQNFDAMGAIVADYRRSFISSVADSFDAEDVCVIMFDSDGAYTLTSTPTIDNAVDGQILVLTNVGANVVTLQDETSLAGTELKLSAATVALGLNDSITLLYVGENSNWVQVAFSNNL